MEADSIKDLQFALRVACEIYELEEKDIQIEAHGNYFYLTFFFMRRKITVEKREDRDHDIYLGIHVTAPPTRSIY